MIVHLLFVAVLQFRMIFLPASCFALVLWGGLLFKASANLDRRGGKSALLDLTTGLFGVSLLFLLIYAFYPQISRVLFAGLAILIGIASSALFRLRNK